MKGTKFRGFTLIELVIVIGIIGVLSAIIIPSAYAYIRKARRAADLITARTIAEDASTLMFTDDDAYRAFYGKKGSQYNQNAFRVVFDNQHNQYKLPAICKISGKGGCYHPCMTWTPFDTTAQNGYAVFTSKLNKVMMRPNTKYSIPMKYSPDSKVGKNGKKLEADTWALCYHYGSEDLEVWIGDSHGQWGFEAMYCLYPYISDGY